MTQSEKSDSDANRDDAIRDAKRIRERLIDLSYDLPDPASDEVLKAWSEADRGMFNLIRALTQ